MLAAQNLMGTHGGQQNHFPFGYIPTELHGIGLPDYMTPGPPPGQPLLNEHDSQTLNTFFNGFDSGNTESKVGSLQPYSNAMSQPQEWAMPPTFVASETSLQPRPSGDWPQQSTGTPVGYGADMHLTQMQQQADYPDSSYHPNTSGSGQFNDDNTPSVHALHAAALQSIPSAHAQAWPHGLPPQPLSHVQSQIKPPMRFGSDTHFHPGGYDAPDGEFDPNAQPNLDWIEAQSSAPTTQPNTQPSSPTWTKKRKLDDLHSGQGPSAAASKFGPSDTTPATANGHPSSGPKMKPDAAPAPPPMTPAPIMFGFTQQSISHLAGAQSADASDNESPSRSTSPAPWPSNKARPPRTGRPASPPASAKAKKKAIAIDTSVKPKPKGLKSASAVTPTSRVPLTADQKKANHTNSEQRRRDATAKAYAELYDLIPELEDMGKQSTMKKLEVVVEKVAAVKQRVAELRALFGYSQTGHAHAGIPGRPSSQPGTTAAMSDGSNMFGAGPHQW